MRQLYSWQIPIVRLAMDVQQFAIVGLGMTVAGDFGEALSAPGAITLSDGLQHGPVDIEAHFYTTRSLESASCTKLSVLCSGFSGCVNCRCETPDRAWNDPRT